MVPDQVSYYFPTSSAASTAAPAELWLSHPGSTATESTPASAAGPSCAVRSIRRSADNNSEPATTPSDSAPTSTAAAPTTAANTAARCSGRTYRRNPDCPADH